MLKKHSIYTKTCSVLSLFEQIVLVISKFLQILGLQPRISKVFLDHQNNFFSHQVITILVTKYHFLHCVDSVAELQHKSKEENVCDKMVAKNFPCLSLLTVTHANALLQPKIYCQNLDSKTTYLCISHHYSNAKILSDF